MIKNVIFDVGGVLISIDAKDRIERMNINAIRKKELLNIILTDPIWKETDVAKFDSFALAFPYMIERHKEYKDELSQFFTPDWMNCYRLLDKGYSIFKRCIESDLNVFILSNFSKDGFLALNQKFDFFKEAKDYLISSHVKIRKPDKRIFRLAEEKFDIYSNETLFIDDREENCQSASSLGFNSILYSENTIDEKLKQYLSIF